MLSHRKGSLIPKKLKTTSKLKIEYKISIMLSYMTFIFFFFVNWWCNKRKYFWGMCYHECFEFIFYLLQNVSLLYLQNSTAIPVIQNPFLRFILWGNNREKYQNVHSTLSTLWMKNMSLDFFSFFHNLVWKMFGFVWFLKIFGFLCIFWIYPPVSVMEFYNFIRTGQSRFCKCHKGL